MFRGVCEGMPSNEDLVTFEAGFNHLADLLENSTDGGILSLNSFKDFTLDVFAKSYPQYNFDTWHVHKICDFMDDVINSPDRMCVCALPRYHLKCLSISHMILLNNGLQKQAKDIKVGDKPVAYDDYGHLIDAKVKAVEFCRQKAKKIKLQTGKEIIASNNHRFYCNLRWKLVSEIKVGDLMAEPMNIKVETDNKLSELDAVLLGYFYSEGSKDLKAIVITNESEKAFEDLTLVAKEHNWGLWKGKKGHYRFNKINGHYGNVKDAPIHYLKDTLGVKSKEYLTEELFKASDEMVSIFLQRFWFGDGTINAKTCQMSVTQKSEQLCKDIQILLLRFGIVSSISSALCKTQKGMERYYWLSISSQDSIDKFAQKIGFLKEAHIKSYNKLNEKRKFEKSDYIPAIWRDCITSKRSGLLHKIGADSDYSYSTPRYKLEKACALVDNPVLDKITTSDVCWKRVISIEDVGEQDLVDIQLTPEGAFIGNGIICHNSTLLGYSFSIYRMLTSNGDGLYLSFKEELANFHLSNIKNVIGNNPTLSLVMKDLRPQSSSGIEYRIGNRKVRMFSSGIFAMKRGLHTDGVLVVDDILGTVDNPLSLVELEKAQLMFDQEVANIPNKECPLVVFGTTIDYTDLLFKLRKNPRFKCLWLPAINPMMNSTKEDVLKYGEHEVLWEDRFPKEELDLKKEIIGWKAFSTEFLLTPIMALEAFFNKPEIDEVTDKSLKNLSLYREFDKEWHHVVAGLDIGKRRNPSHLSVFVDDNLGNLRMIHQSFWDNMDYVDQIDRIKAAVENFHIDKLYLDATRGEMEERGLPREVELIKFSGRGERNKNSYATDFAKYVEKKRIKLIDDDRFIGQIVCVTNTLDSPSSPLGHGDSFVSIMLAIGAYRDNYAPDRHRGSLYLGDFQEIFDDKKNPLKAVKDDICKICNKKTIKQLDNGNMYCETCFAEYTLVKSAVKEDLDGFRLGKTDP